MTDEEWRRRMKAREDFRMTDKDKLGYLIETIKAMCNAMDNELTGEILNELMRAKARIEDWENDSRNN